VHVDHLIPAAALVTPDKSMMGLVDDQLTTGFSITPTSLSSPDSSLVEIPPDDSPNQSVESPSPPVLLPNAIPAPVVHRADQCGFTGNLKD